MAILPDRNELSSPADGDLYMTTDVSDTGDAATGTDKKITWANIKLALKTYFDTIYQPLSAVLTATTASFTTAMADKLGFITVTQGVDLDQMEADIAALANGMSYEGNWDASAGSFPGAGSAQKGFFYTVSVGGTVDGVTFVAGDRLIATVDNASATVYAANWTQLDATDAVTSVDGATGNIELATILFAKTAKTTPVDADTVSFTDSAAANVLKKVTWANVKVTLKAYFDTLYVQPRGAVNTQTGTTYTLVIGDEYLLGVTMNNAAANTITIPPNADVALPVGTKVFITQGGAGSTTIAAGAGVTINAPASVTAAIGEQHGSRVVQKIQTNEWLLI